MIKQGFGSSMQAIIYYHKAVADALSRDGDRKLVKYHTLMSDVYSALLLESKIA